MVENMDEEGLAAFGEVMDFILPYLLPNKSDEARNLLSKLGVENRSHLFKVSYPHISSVMSLVQHTTMLELLESSDNSSTVTKGDYHLNLTSLLSKSLMQQLKGDDILSRYNRRKILNLVVDDIFENKQSTITEKYLLRLAEQLVDSYSIAFGCTENDQRTEAALSVKNSMFYHLRHLQRTNKESRNHAAQKTKKFSKGQNYGLINDLPSYTDKEESTVHENRRTLLVTMYKAGNFNQKVILKLMQESYIAIRSDINDQLNMEELLVKWPFIGITQVLTDHFGKLCEKPTEPDLHFLAQWIEFFKYLSHQTRKGNKKDFPLLLAQTIRKWNKDEKTKIIVIILCIMIHLEIPKTDVFLMFEETTSFDEIQASELLPEEGKPVLALLGSDPLKDPKCFLIIEKRCTSESPITTAEGLIQLIMAYFIFKITYNPRTAPLLDFMQRKILRIENGDGSRIERQRSEKGWGHASPEVSKKYLMLMRDFNFFMKTFADPISEPSSSD